MTATLAAPRFRSFATAVLLAATAFAGCRMEDGAGQSGGAASDGAEATDAPASQAGAERSDALALTLQRADALADSVEDLLRPVPLMRPGDVEALRRYSNAQNVARARELGARPADSTELAELVDAGRFVRLEDSTDLWVVRELGASRPFVTPDTRALLVRLGEAFQERLQAMGLPAYRFEVSSVLRTAESQAALRQRNRNAAAGTSSHEFGTTLDIAYSGYTAPADLPAGLVPDDAADPAALEAVARAVLERVAARKSRELQAILGQVMRDAQSRGDVLVTFEQQQPVYHITVARSISD